MNASSSGFHPQPVTLNGDLVRLEPLELDHAAALLETVNEANWDYMVEPLPTDVEAMEGLIARALVNQADGHEVPFVLRSLADDRIVGSTRFMSIVGAHRVVEIGFTWLAPEAQRTGINTEMKFLLLDHAFRQLGALRVEFKTDSRNTRSIRALERIGATREGVLRRHRLCPDGHHRDSVYFSILDIEWEQRTRHFIRLMRR